VRKGRDEKVQQRDVGLDAAVGDGRERRGKVQYIAKHDLLA
jgi:hypothetical protein